MKCTYTVAGLGRVTLTDKEFLASGGEAQIFVKDGTAYKIYHDPKDIIPTAKLKELQAIKSANVLKPENVIYDPSGVPVGVTMVYKKDTVALCQLFTKVFKARNGISNDRITALIEFIQNIVANEIHPADCLVVDMNELNILTSMDFKTPFFIDVDSYQTPSFRATALMESVRDHLVHGNNWTTDSDWYSFAIIAFTLWINIHPYRGSHPDYKANDWQKRMEDGVSVFDPKATIPAICNPFSVIPPSHLDWLKRILLKNERGAPPRMGAAATAGVAMPAAFKIIASSDKFAVSKVEECVENILGIFNYIGINYMMGTNAIHKGRATLPIEVAGYSKVLMCEADSVPVIAKLKNGTAEFNDSQGKFIGKIAAKDMMYRNACIYTVNSEILTENTFVQYGDRIVHATRMAGNVLGLATKVFDGVIFQDLLGKAYLTLPYQKGKCATFPAKELDGYRVLDARSEKNICGVMAERKGVYYLFILTFNENYSSYTLRVNKDVPYSDVNLTVLPNGVAVLATTTTCEIFKDSSVKVIDNPPFNSTTRLFNYSGGIHYVDGRDIMAVNVKR